MIVATVPPVFIPSSTLRYSGFRERPTILLNLERVPLFLDSTKWLVFLQKDVMNTGGTSSLLYCSTSCSVLTHVAKLMQNVNNKAFSSEYSELVDNKLNPSSTISVN